MKNLNRPIGVFDSGVGGLSILKKIIQKLPKENTIYCADTGRRRYGNKPKNVIQRYSFEIIDFLISKNVKLVVIGCNTASSVALFATRKKYDIPIIGVVEPGVSMALKKITKNSKLGIIGGEITCKAKIHRKLIKKASSNLSIEVFEQETPPFGEFVEQGLRNKKEIQKTIDRYLSHLKEKEIDILILGCTHYPFLQNFIRNSLGPRVILIDPAEEVVAQIKKILDDKDLLNFDNYKAHHSFYTSGDVVKFKFIAQKLLKKNNLNVDYKKFGNT